MQKIILALLLLIGGQSFAQIRVEGVVKDSLGNPLEMANVIAINKATKALDSYGITNSDGKYKLSLKENDTYELQVSYIGLKTLKTTVETKEENINKNFSLEPDNTLEEVELTYEMPVTVKGDTLVYNADSFTSGTEKKLEDVLNKLPGVEVTDDGEIEVEGKTVGKVMVEGKDFFDGDSKLATKNIPADAVSKVEVLKNHNDVGQLRGLGNDEDNIAINIKLKEGKKNFWFGEVTAGAGLDERYLVHPKLFYYSPKYSVNIITDMNNIGEIPFTRRDYFKFTGGFRGANRSSGTNFNVASSDMGFLTMRNDKAQEINTKFGAANFSYSPKKSWDISGFGIFSGTRTDMLENGFSRTTIPEHPDPNNPNNTVPEQVIDESTTSKTHQKSDLGLFKLSTVYKPNSNNQLDYDAFVKISGQRERQGLNSSLYDLIGEQQEQNPFSLNQNLNYYYTLNDKNIFALEVQHLWQDEDPFYNAIIENNNTYSFDTVLNLDNSTNGYNLNQEKRVKTNKFDAKIDYWYVLNDKSNINITVGEMFSKQQFNSELYQILDSGSVNNLTPSIGSSVNNIAYKFNDLYVGLHYKLKVGKFTFTPGASLHYYSMNNEQFGTGYTDNFVRLLPDFNTRIQLKSSENININYQMQTDFTDVNQLAEGLVMNNYNSLFAGNRQLENALSHNFNLSYFSFNMFNYTNVFAMINYNKREDAVRGIAQSIPNTNLQTSTSTNSNFADESLSANGRFERTIGKFKASVRASISYSKFNQINNGQRFINESITQTYTPRLGTNFREAPNFDIGYRFTINKYLQGNESKFITQAPFIRFDALFLKNFVFKADYTYNNYKNEERTINEYSFLDADLTYQKKDSKWEYTIGATNILDTESLNQDNSSDFSINTSEYFVQPRYLVFKIKYNL
ncbi:carboxypeptidase-like regulatory domain-containing protein [Pseudofulvibacter geojedonensis]|uniref:Carboxypeptidase-like regulatory domain-containing protein n=1 Tax=Pseudofulvibacter geojedonensis TaxID=1123758 RepID=A0ABW3I603_9FLAO